MPPKNLWGDLPEFKVVTTPEKLLNEQAAQLAQLTRGSLEGLVKPIPQSPLGEFAYRLSVSAPSLNNHSVSLLTLGHPIGLFPVKVVDTLNEGGAVEECPDYESFEKAVAAILTSEQARSMIASLLSHVRSM